MKNSNKRKITGCVGGVILLLLVTALVACSKDNGDVEVASITEVAETEEPITEEADTEEPETEEPITEEVETDETETEEADTEEAETEETETEDSDTEEPDTEESNTETTEPATTSPTTTSSSWGTPQDYSGDPEGKGPGRIIVKGFNYNDAIPGGSSDTPWRGEYWTASNGVEIKIVSYDDYTGGTGRWAVMDGKGKDNEPNSPFMQAVLEAEGKALDRYASIDMTLPLSSYKKTEIDINDSSLVEFRNAYDYKLYELSNNADQFTPYKQGDPINMRLAVSTDGIGEIDITGAQMWRIRRVGDYWELKMNVVPVEFRWDGIHQVLRYLNPDGDSLYQVIYEDVYYGSPVILDYDEWFAVGNSQIYQKQTTDMGYMIYYFK